MIYNYIKKFSTIFLFYAIILKIVKGEDYDVPVKLHSDISGFLGFKCNFSKTGVHNLEPDVVEGRSVFCSINSYFLYDKIRLIIPKKKDESKFKILPEQCFQKVYTDFDNKVEKDFSELGLVEYEISENDSSEDHIEKIVTISPFNDNDVEFFCFCDNTEKVISGISGRTALVHVHVLKYPNDILSINLTKDSFGFLNDPKGKDDFENQNLEVQLKEGDLLVLACDLIDKKCFQKSKGKTLYKSNKLIYHKKFAIFKAPMYIKSEEFDAMCTCKVDNTLYNVIVKPKKIKNKIEGCDFTTENESDNFSNSFDIMKLDDNTPKICKIDIKEKNYNHLIGINCPGEILPDCFFQVYEPTENLEESSKLVHLDTKLNIGNIEYYEDIQEGNKMKIFGFSGVISKDSSFICLCKKDKKTGYMLVTLASAYHGLLAKIFIFLIVILLLFI